MIAKRDGRREPYIRDKLLQGLRIACRKRPIRTQDIEALADDVERALIATGRKEVPSDTVGDSVMEGLRQLDQVAYIRFASVYKSFESLASFDRILMTLDRDRDGSGDDDSADHDQESVE